MFATPSHTAPPSCHGPQPRRTRKRSASPSTIPFSPRHSNLFCLSTSALPTPPASPSSSPSTSYLLPPAPLLPAAPVFSSTSTARAAARRRESLGLRSSPMRRSPGMRNMAFFTNAALEEDERAVREYEEEARGVREAAARLDGQWFRAGQGASPTRMRGPVEELGGSSCFDHGLAGTPASSSEVEFDAEEGPFDMDDSAGEEDASILPAMRSWREPSSASATQSSPISFSSPWAHSASSSLATSVSSFAPSPRCRDASLAKLAGLRSPELRSATESRFDVDLPHLVRPGGLERADSIEGLGLGLTFAI